MGADENATKCEICDFSISLCYMIFRCEKNSQQTKLQVLLGSGSTCSEIKKKLAASCKLLPTQDMMVMNSRISDDDDDVNAQLRKRLTEASIKAQTKIPANSPSQILLLLLHNYPKP